VLAAFVASGCGGRPSAHEQLAASCRRQTEAVAAIGPIRSLAQGERALARVIDLEQRSRADLRRAETRGDDPSVTALRHRVEREVSDARGLRDSLEQADPTQTMSPLQVGPAGARRAVERASAIARETCRLSRR
jgi:hypothetical protein